MKIYSIEGNIGAGKTKLWNSLKDYVQEKGDSTAFLAESAMEVSKSSSDLLKRFYDEPTKYCVEFETKIIEHGCESVRTALRVHDGDIVLDSSLLTTRNVFIPSAIERNFLDEDVGKDMIKNIDIFFATESVVIHPIWLPTKPKQCFEQIQQRARPGKEQITLGLLRRHHDLYKQWLAHTRLKLWSRPANFDLNLEKLVEVLF